MRRNEVVFILSFDIATVAVMLVILYNWGQEQAVEAREFCAEHGYDSVRIEDKK